MTMTSVPTRFQIHQEPQAASEALVYAPQARFTVLTSRLIRLEYSPDDVFEDQASQAFWFRRQPVPEFDVRRDGDQVEITTEHLRLRYRPSPRGFTRDTLSIAVAATGVTWHYGDRDQANLNGTVRTLDGADGPVRLMPGLMSRAGWTVVDDSATLVFDEAGWLQPRSNAFNFDLYFLGYGHDYLGCLQDYCRVTGRIPLIPRWALGNWWSRYWEYTQSELTQLMLEFRNRAVPLSVCVIDMDWHITHTGNASTGWTGYTWNRELFPDPEGFLRWLHVQGLKTSLNLHPAEGVHPHEAVYPELCQRLGLDPATSEPVPFDITDPRFAEAYFDVLHGPLERQGVDFWWMDWQQGQTCRLPGLDPLWWLNHLHFYDLGRDPRRRPLIFSRWGGLGNHRYPIGFSGDTVVSWRSLAFQPHLTATSSNVGCVWWSHDIGGHFYGQEDPELYLRWVQWGAFSPILRLHSAKNPYHERRPWGFDAETFHWAREALQLRHALIPYLYSQAWHTWTDSRPLLQPMYYQHPEVAEAYTCPSQYYFGSDLIAAPYTNPREADTNLSRQSLWLPPGQWFDFFNGEPLAGSRWHARYGGLDDIPVVARAGAIVPLGPRVGWGGVENPAELFVYAFPGAGGRFELYEDDGESQAYLDGEYAVTVMTQRWQDGELRLVVAPAEGDRAVLPERRTYHFHVRGVRSPESVTVQVSGRELAVAHGYDEATETLALAGVSAAPADEVVLTLRHSDGLLGGRDRRAEKLRQRLRAFRLETNTKRAIDRDLPDLLAGRTTLLHYNLTGGQVAALESALG